MLEPFVDASQAELHRVYDAVRDAGISAEPIRNSKDEFLAVKLRPDGVRVENILVDMPNQITGDYAEERLNVRRTLPYIEAGPAFVDASLYPYEALTVFDLIVAAASGRRVLATNFNSAVWTHTGTLKSDLHIDDIKEQGDLVGGLNIHVTRLGSVSARFGLLRNFLDYDNSSQARTELERTCAPFSEPVTLRPNDWVVFRGTGSKIGFLPVAHDFVTQIQPRQSDAFTPEPGNPEQVQKERNMIIGRYGLNKLGYSVLPAEVTTAA